MATIRKRNERWQAQVRRVGIAPVSRTFTRRADAVAWSLAQELSIETGGQLVPKHKQSQTLADLLERYERDVVPRKRGNAAEVYVTKALRRLPMAKKRLVHINAADFAEFRDDRLETVKPATLRRQMNVLRHALHTAGREWGWVVPLGELEKIELPNAAQFHVERISDDAINAVTEFLASRRNKAIATAVKLSLHTGMRRGELLSLRWSDVAKDHKSIFVRTSKSGFSRTLPLTSDASDLLRSLSRTEGHVVPISANALKLAFQRARTAAGVRFRFHDLRHEAISRFFEMGLTIPEVQALSGHRTLSQLSRYAHPDLARIADKLASFRLPPS
ncbi:MAG: site-specific integrase [Sphingomonadales bacterium]|nr:MAG: site-specific integrase [Sphingomonadales bacterium]